MEWTKRSRERLERGDCNRVLAMLLVMVHGTEPMSRTSGENDRLRRQLEEWTRSLSSTSRELERSRLENAGLREALKKKALRTRRKRTTA